MMQMFLEKFRNFLTKFQQKKCDFRAVQRIALCRSRRELSNAYFLAKFRFDAAENEPSKVCPIELSAPLLEPILDAPTPAGRDAVRTRSAGRLG